MKLYVYCLMEGSEALPISLTGIAGGAVRLLKAGSLSLLVSDFSGDTVLANRENALAHAAVVRSVLDQTTPLPFRFGTLVTEEQLQTYLTARADALQAKLELVRGCVEMNVKIIAEQEGAEEQQQEDATETPGTAFLAQKRREILGSEVRVAQAKQVELWLDERVGEFVKEKRIEANPGAKLILAAAHLVSRGEVEAYRARIKEAREARPELHFLLSGPWPPYSFANIDLEFKSHFGVS